MGRSKQRGKAVEELGVKELLQEKHRCETMIRVYRKGATVKGLQKRLHHINKRIEQRH
jgi:hypothetical protein